MSEPDNLHSWTEVFGDDVVLKNSTYESHRGVKSASDWEAREKALEAVPAVLRDPKYVYRDKDRPDTRAHYSDLWCESSISPRLKLLVVVVDIERKPKEVVTWLIKRNLNEEDTSGGLLYERSGGTSIGS